ncbi:serine--tRNA synthetase-like protein Slimp [Chrysoperla carnea]|uniref:serine--tRNA synthetase-like protein Slimp n=1 Tax=Chrysoperla carnea TaxID=189513 RepID=UPI001D079F16|nr:serine--tRNA synthetase-like protein Slimp [Chrysoperla carnea]
MAVLLKNYKPLYNILRRGYSNAPNAIQSVLYVSRDKATAVNAYVTPCVEFDFQKLCESVNLRKLNINMAEIVALWNYYKHLESNKNQLEHKKQFIVDSLRMLSKEPLTDQITDKMNKLKTHGKFVREDLKVMKEKLNVLESDVILRMLNLPNVVHPNTPKEDIIVHEFESKPSTELSHLNVGTKLNLIEYNNPQYYFLKGDAAMLELHIMNYGSHIFSNEDFIPVSNPDFVRSIVVEGCGRPLYDDSSTFILKNKDDNPYDDLHLVGGSSVLEFMAIHTKNMVYSSILPLKYFNIGRKYTPTDNNCVSSSAGLFTASQSTTLEIFIATLDSDDQCGNEFKNVLDLVTQLYEMLGYHFRIVYKCPENLHKWESFRADIEMFSSSLNDYVVIGHISISDSYYSKRLMFQYVDNKEKFYPKVISGCIIDYPKLLGCILEQKCFENSSEIIPSHIMSFQL